MNKPNKGFIKEISKPKPTSKPVKAFDYSKAQVPVPKTEAMATPYRIKEMKQVRPAKSQLTEEMAAHILKRQGK